MTDRVEHATRTLYRRFWQPLGGGRAQHRAREAGSARALRRDPARDLGRGRRRLPCRWCRATACRRRWSIRRSRICGRRAPISASAARLRALGFARERVTRARSRRRQRDARRRTRRSCWRCRRRSRRGSCPDLAAPERVPRHRQRALPHRARAATRRWFVGVIGGTAEWVFRKREVLSVTVSAADRLIDMPAEELAPLLWRDVAARLRPAAASRCRRAQIVKEKRATFAATPAQESRAGRGRRRAGPISRSPAIGPIPGCRRRSKARFARALPRRMLCSEPLRR